MRDGDYDNLVRKLADDHIVRKVLEDEPFGAARACGTGHARQRDHLVFEKVKSGIEDREELHAKPDAPALVPRCRFDRFFGGLVKDSNAAHYRPPSRAFILRRNSSRSMSFAVPESISASRR